MSEQALKQQLAEIIENVVGTPVAHDDLLIESGLVDSMTAVDIVMAVKTAFGVKVPATEIDEHLESLDALAAFIQNNR